MMDGTLCCRSRGTAPNVQLCLLKWAFILCWGPSSISRDVLSEFFSYVDSLSFVSKCQRSGCLDPSSPEVPSTPEESLENALNLIVFSITLPILVWWEIVWPLNYTDLSRHPNSPCCRSVCSWMCPSSGVVLLTLGWGCKTSGSHTENVSEAEARTGERGDPGSSGPGSWHGSGCQQHLLWLKSEQQQIVHVCFWWSWLLQ